MKTQMAWKVVRVWNGKMISAISMFPVHYRPRKWATPHAKENQFLFVFSTRANARLYTKTMIADRIRDGQKFRICRCKVRNLTDDRLSISGRWMSSWSSLPQGTVYADAVKIV